MDDLIAIRPGRELGVDGGSVRTWVSRFALPLDLVHQARRRLGILAVTFGGLCVITGAVYSTEMFSAGTGAAQVIPISIFGTAVLSFALFYAARSSRLSNAVILPLGLAYQILICLSASTVVVWAVCPIEYPLR